jgi:hypothetical protein
LAGGGAATVRLGAVLGAGGAGASVTPLVTPVEESLRSGVEVTSGGSGNCSGAASTGAVSGGGGVNAAGLGRLKKHPLEIIAVPRTIGIASRAPKLGH